MNTIETLKENLINDFLDYLDENEQEISTNWITNECHINNYLMTIFYTIQDNTETIEEAEATQDEFYEILDKYCCYNAMPEF